MSLINQMLKDLEKRSSAGASPAAGVPAGLVSVAGSRKGRRALWAGLALVLLVAGGLAGLRWFAAPGPAPEAPAEIAAMPAAPAVPNRPPEVVDEPHPGAAELPAVEAARDPASLERVQIAQRDDRLQVALTFSMVPTYRLIWDEPGRQLVLEMPEGAATASLPDVAGLPLLRSLTSERRDEGARLVLSFTQVCRYDELSWSDGGSDGGRTLHFVVRPESTGPVPMAAQLSPAAEVPGDTGAMTADSTQSPPAVAGPGREPALVRREVQPTPREQVEQLWQDAITLLRQGRQREAENGLRAALALEPGHIGARDLLLRVLERQQRQAEIRALLVEGAREAPQHPPYRLRYARLLVEEGELGRAREQLTREPRPAVSEALDLYALLATVYQRRGEHQEAAHTYRALLAVRPEQAVWWMGLGIALEGSGLQGQSEQAYRQALSRGGLADGLQTYIRQRLGVLGARENITEKKP